MLASLESFALGVDVVETLDVEVVFRTDVVVVVVDAVMESVTLTLDAIEVIEVVVTVVVTTVVDGTVVLVVDVDVAVVEF